MAADAAAAAGGNMTEEDKMAAEWAAALAESKGGGEGGSAVIVCSVAMFDGVTPSTSHSFSSPRPTSTVTSFCEADSGSTATARGVPAAAAWPPSICERLKSHSSSGIEARMATNHSTAVQFIPMCRRSSVRSSVALRCFRCARAGACARSASRCR